MAELGNIEMNVEYQISPCRWEYLVRPTMGNESHNEIALSALLNDIGQAGWELTLSVPNPSRYGPILIFKRPVEDSDDVT